MPNYLSSFAPYIYGTLSFLFAFIILLKILEILLKKRGKNPAYITYRVKQHFITPTEMLAFDSIRVLLPPGLHLCAKPRIADILEVERGNKRSGFCRISQKHVDFLIIETATGKPQLAIEIDDRTHLSKKRQERDAFVDRSFSQAGIPIARFWAGQPIALEAIQKHFPIK